MNAKLVEDIANAVLYEGYMLYPYRPSSVKNRQRWNFGVVYPRIYSEQQSGSDNWFMQTECLVTGDFSAQLSVKVRFLQAVARTIGELKTPLDELPVSIDKRDEPDFQIVETLQVGDQILQTWQEAIEREIVLPPFRLADLLPRVAPRFLISRVARSWKRFVAADGRIAAVIVRTKDSVTGKVEVAAECVEDGLFKITVRISNITATTNPNVPEP